MQKYRCIRQGKDCALYCTKYNDGDYKYMVKDKEGDVIGMSVNPSPYPPTTLIDMVDTYDLEKIHADKRAEHDKWVKEFVE